MAIAKLTLGTLAPGDAGYPAYAAAVYSKLLEVADAMALSKPTFSTIAAGQGNPAGDITLAANSLSLIIDQLNSGGSGSPVVLTVAADKLALNGGISQATASLTRYAAFSVAPAVFNASTVDIALVSTFPYGPTASVYVSNTAPTSTFNTGTLVATLRPAADGASHVSTVSLPGSGQRWLYVITGGQQRTNDVGDVLATSVQSLTFPAGSTASFFAVPPGTVWYLEGDSLSVGGTTDIPEQQSAAAYLRGSGIAAIVPGYGSRRAQVAIGTSSARTATLAPVIASNPQAYIDQLGLNDLLNAGSTGVKPADIQAWKTAWYQAIQAALPNVKIYAQTLLHFVNDTSRTFGGYSRADWNAAITAAAAAVPGVTVIDGGALVNVAKISDGDVHYSAAGYQDIATNLNSIISTPLGLPGAIPWKRIFSADNGAKDYLSGQTALTVPSGRGAPTAVANAIGSRMAFDFVRAENDAFNLNIGTSGSPNYLLAAVVNVRSYEGGNEGFLLSAIPGATDPGWALRHGSSLLAQGKVIDTSVPTGSPQVVIYFIDSSGNANVRINGVTYQQAPGNAGGTGGVADMTSNINFIVGSYQGQGGYSIDGLVAAIAMAPGLYSEAQAIQVEAALKTYYGL